MRTGPHADANYRTTRAKADRMCRCGCGLPAPLAPKTHTSRGWVRGEPLTYRKGHHGRRPAEERFWEKVEKTDGCWVWKGGYNADGYGAFTDGKKTGAHRFSWVLANGEIPAGLQVCHKCDNPPCVRPDHLFLGTNQENVDDAYAKGHYYGRRHRYGQGLSAEAIRDVTPKVLELKRQGLSQPRIAAELGLSRETVQRIQDRARKAVAA